MAGRFSNFTLAVQGIKKEPSMIAEILQNELTQTEIDRLEPLLTPDATDEEKLETLKELKNKLLRDGIDDTELHAAIDTMIGELTT